MSSDATYCCLDVVHLHIKFRPLHVFSLVQLSEKLASLDIIKAHEIKNLLNPNQYPVSVAPRGLRGTLNCAPIMPLGVSLSDRRYEIILANPREFLPMFNLLL